MTRYSDQIRDEFNRPVPGASIYVYDAATEALDTLTDDTALPLANPLTSDEFGDFYFNAADGQKLLEFHYGGSLQWKEQILVGPLPVGPVGPAGDVAKAVDRTALAATATPVTQMVRWLAEVGREGMFQFVATNLSAMVTADSRQAVYVAPVSDATGASGAWVRKRDGDYLHIDWFGAAGDGVTDDTASFVAMRTLGIAESKYASGGVQAGPKIVLGFATYALGTSFDCKGFTADWHGNGGGWSQWPNSAASTIQMASGQIWYFQRANTEGNTTGTTIPFGCDGSKFYNISFTGPGKGVGTAPVAKMRGRVELYNCRFSDGGGHGLEISATAGGGGALEGNANLWKVIGRSCSNNGKSGIGVGVSGATADVNGGECRGVDFSNNAEFGFVDLSFLGNVWDPVHSAANGLTSNAIANNGTNYYFVVAGQETGASTNAPPAGATDNTWWYFGGAGSSAFGRTWTSGLTWTAGGAFRTGNAPIEVTGYTESGQGYAQLGTQTKYDNGTNGAGRKGGCRSYAASGNLTVETGGFRAYFPATGLDIRFGCNDVSGDILTVAGNGYTNSARTFQITGNIYTGIGTNGADRDSLWLGVSQTDWQLGSGVSMGFGVKVHRGHAVGDGTSDFNQARRRYTMPAAPTGASPAWNGAAFAPWARGDIVYNRDLGAAVPMSWLTTATGSPGTQLADYPNARADPATGIGYVTGAGGAVTQATSKATGVPLSKVCGQVTLNNAALAGGANVTFTVTDANVAATDTILLNLQSGNATDGAYDYRVGGVAAGSFKITVENRSGGSLSEALVFNYARIKAVNA